MTKHASAYGFIRAVASETWHWEYHAGSKCNAIVKYACSNAVSDLEESEDVSEDLEVAEAEEEPVEEEEESSEDLEDLVTDLEVSAGNF